MSEIWTLVIVAIVIILGGYWLGYRSGKHRALEENRKDKPSDKE